MKLNTDLTHARDLTRSLALIHEYHLNSEAALLLAHLWVAGGSLTLRTLSLQLGFRTFALTALATALEAAGHLALRPSHTDPRITWLELTPSGRRTMADILGTPSSHRSVNP